MGWIKKEWLGLASMSLSLPTLAKIIWTGTAIWINYCAAKAKLFHHNLLDGGTAVLNADDANGNEAERAAGKSADCYLDSW